MSETAVVPDLAERAQRPGYIRTLDGWRAVAILVVLTDHAFNYFATSAQDLARWGVPPALGLHGVGVFFALSGFLITTRLVEEYKARGRVSLRDFYIRRTFRILPAAVVVLAALALLGFVGLLPMNGNEILGALFFYRNYLPSVYAPDGTGFFTAHYWSLAVEEHFYLFWPAVLVLALRRNRAIAVAACCAVLLVAWRQVELSREISTYGRVLPTFFVRSDTRMDALLWGAVAALALDQRRVREWAERYVTTVVLLGVVAVYLAVWWRFRTQPTCWEGITAALMVAATVVRPNAAPGTMLELAPLRWVGRISYSIYLTNNAFIPFKAIGIPVTLGALQQMPFNVIAVAVCATALYYFVERPMIGLGRRFAPPVTSGRPIDESSSRRATPPMTPQLTA